MTRSYLFSRGITLGLLVLTVLGLSHCRTMPATERAQEPQLVFAVAAAAQDAREVTPTVARVTAGSAELTGTIATPNPCYDISGALAADRRQLRLQLTARPREGLCVQKLGAFAFRATITGLLRGAYDVTITYTYPGTGWEQRTHKLALDIP